MTRALHVVTNPNCQIAATKIFRRIYDATKQQHFPLGIRMRFIPMASAVSHGKIYDLKKCRLQQRGWLNSIEHTTYDGIELLDTSSQKMPTLRNMIMKLKSKSDGNPLFISVNTQWNNNEKTIFTFRRKLANEARPRIPTLLTYLIHTTKYKNCNVYFTQSAQNEAQQNVWGESTKEVVRAADQYVPSDAINEDIILLGLQDYISYNDPTVQDTERSENIYLGTETSSVNSFTSGNTNQRTTSKFYDTSTVGSKESDIQTSTASTQHATSDYQALRQDIAQMNKNLTILDANSKSKQNDILGRILMIEKQLAPPPAQDTMSISGKQDLSEATS
jgi:hypothetical protein